MEEQIPSSIPPQNQPPSSPGTLTPEMIEALKARAREEAIRMTMLQKQSQSEEEVDRSIARVAVPPSQQIPVSQPQPQVVYVRRNFTVAELGLIILLSCGLVTAFQAGWHFVSNNLPRIEIKAK